MVIDSSAILAILQNEPESRAFRNLIVTDARRLVSAATLVETSMVVLTRQGEEGLAQLRAFISAAGITVVPLDEEQARVAVDAFRLFGKGRHAAGLNFGDCLAYALSRATDEPLLFKGNDFGLTDVSRVG